MRRQLFNTIDAWLAMGGLPDRFATFANGIAKGRGILLSGSEPQLIKAFANMERRSMARPSSGPSEIIELSIKGNFSTADRNSPFNNNFGIDLPS